MTYRVRPSIVATVADYGGSFVAHMLEAVGAFDPPELSDVWACDETWLSMLVSLRDFHLAVLRRSPQQYVVPNERVFLVVRRVVEELCSLIGQSFIFKFDDAQSKGDESLVSVLVSLLPKRMYDNRTIVAFLLAAAESLDEAPSLIRELQRALVEHGINAVDVHELILQYSTGSMASALTSSEAFIAGGSLE